MDAWAAYQLDVVVLSIGSEIEAALMDGKSLDEAIGPRLPTSTGGLLAPAKAAAPPRFRDPTPMVSARVAIHESGIW